jgi:hypothetical protein
MKVQVESSLSNPNTKDYQFDLITLDGIVRAALLEPTLEHLKEAFKAMHTSGFEYGFGSNHCWVKQIKSNNRILFITM